MPVSDKFFAEKISNLGLQSLSPIELLQLNYSASGTLRKIDQPISNISNLNICYPPSENTGRIVYVSDERVYYFSDGVSWTKNLTSNFVGQLWTTGLNSVGQLGNNTVTNTSSPVSVIGGFTDWCQVSAGFSHTAAVRQNGSLWTWGCGDFGALGNNTLADRSSPVSVIGDFTDWCQVSAGNLVTTAVRQNGTLWAWGCGANGVLGDGTIVAKSSPVSVIGGFTDWCQVSTYRHTAAVRQNGSLWTWGYNNCGQLGNNSTTSSNSPISVLGNFNDWCQVSVGNRHTAAVRQNGTLWSWGHNGNGRLGDCTTVDKSSPVSVVGGFTDWCQVAVGNDITSAIRQNGTLWVWGNGACGRMGDGTTVAKSSPVTPIGGFTDWCQVSAGEAQIVAVRTNGTLWGWGCNDSGRLGDGTNVNKCSPVSLVGGLTNWYEVSTGRNHTIAIVYQKGF